MEKKGTLTKVLAIVGTVLAWFPVLAPFLLSTVAIIQLREFRFDYLMPAELFLFALVGGALLLWAAFRAHSRRGIIGGGLGLAVALLIGAQALAVATGLASGETGTGGWQWVLVLASLAAYSLALVAVAVGGILLLRDLFKPSQPVAAGL